MRLFQPVGKTLSKQETYLMIPLKPADMTKKQRQEMDENEGRDVWMEVGDHHHPKPRRYKQGKRGESTKKIQILGCKLKY